MTVIIPTYRGRSWIRACLGSVLATEGVRPRVVVFDNASVDGTREIVEKEFPQAELVRSPRNVGFARANNQVITRAISRGDDYVFLLNEDARVEPDTLRTLIDVAETHDVSILSPLHYDWRGVDFETDFATLLEQSSLSRSWQKSDFVPTTRVIGAAVLMKLSTLRKVGLFDPIYFIYAEEEDLCRRMRRHGHKVGITPRTRICHGHQATGEFVKLERMRRFNIIRGKYILVLKNPSQTLFRAFLHFLAQISRDVRRVFSMHQLGLALDFLLAGMQVMSLLGRIRRRRKLEKVLA
ncbi:MAG TPA: glycosyltransferase family 2 protein, partial [Planctomycetota bacterium]|nr:glycosyltransferase family 2 protein [Planctomycetota bacterium]